MKKNVLLGLGAMTLCVPLFLSSCSSSDDATETPVNPNSTGSVKTDFTLSVGLPKTTTSGAKSRVSDATAQAQTTPVFRGMDNMTLIPFALTTAGNTVTKSDTRIGTANINLPNAVANSLTSSQITTTGNAKVYTDVSVPLTTNAFLFYAKAIDATAGTNASTATDMFQYGTLTPAGLSDGKPSGISFTPTQIAATPTMTKGEAIATYLTSIATVTGWSAVTVDAQGNGKTLKALYDAFITLSAGSSDAIQNAVQDLYTSVTSIKSSQTTDNQKVCDAITKAITNSTYASAGTDGKLTFTDAINGYPADNNLPDGAATVKWADSKFTAENASTYTTDAVNVGPMANYVYPISLWYRANTEIATSDEALTDQYVNDNAWSKILKKYTENPGTVKSSTRSIALNDQIQYAVGRLDTKVTLGSPTLYDHNGATVAIQDGGFPVTGILVGNQRKVDWEFKPETATDATQYTVYDKDMNTSKSGTTTTSMVASTSGSLYNHTLLLETPEKTPVYMVVEFKNNSGNEFHGYNNEVIPAGSKFYMVAELNPDATSGVTQPTGTNTAFNKEKVIQQDFTTIANLKIGASSTSGGNTGLGAAYNVIPDLRTPALSIGLSVDLTWQSGLTFDIDM
ncbi:MAG: hypothetical protein PUF37_01635 [Prevotellaceae bacterium]|nr:hypothetical protein [Prevotellaceae bacterium]